MNEVTPERWSVRLRDPESKQACRKLRKDSLPSGDPMCCLGHLADLIDPDKWNRTKIDGFPGAHQWQGRVSSLGTHRPSWMTQYQEAIAMYLNDDLHATLSQIADWVDAGMPETWEAPA